MWNMIIRSREFKNIRIAPFVLKQHLVQFNPKRYQYEPARSLKILILDKMAAPTVMTSRRITRRVSSTLIDKSLDFKPRIPVNKGEFKIDQVHATLLNGVS